MLDSQYIYYTHRYNMENQLKENEAQQCYLLTIRVWQTDLSFFSNQEL